MAPVLSRPRLEESLTYGLRIKVKPQDLSAELKDWIAELIIDKVYTTSFISDRLDLSVKTLQKWARNNRNGVANHGGGGGRPRMYSKEASERLARALCHPHYQPDEISYENLRMTALESTALEYKKNVDDVVEPSRFTTARMEKREGIKTGNAEVGTDARITAEADIRNALSFAAMNSMMSKLTDPALILNADATVFTIGNNSGVKKVKYSGPRPKALKTKPRKKDGSNTLGYGIKYMCLISASGMAADPVFLIADEKMKECDFRAYVVPGLGFNVSKSKGHLTFAKTRVGNLAFFNWFCLNVIVPFVRDIKEQYNLNSGEVTWLQLDG